MHRRLVHEPVELLFIGAAFCLRAELGESARSLLNLILDLANAIVLSLLKLIEYDVIAWTAIITVPASGHLRPHLVDTLRQFLDASACDDPVQDEQPDRPENHKAHYHGSDIKCRPVSPAVPVAATMAP